MDFSHNKTGEMKLSYENSNHPTLAGHIGFTADYR
jgi:hypothetical protein